MGKKKKKKKSDLSPAMQKKCDNIAESLSNYTDGVLHYNIIVGKSAKDVKWAAERVKKMCKDLKKGKIEEVFTDEGIEREFGDDY